MMVILPPMLVLGVRKAPRREGWEREDGSNIQCDNGDVRGDIPSLSGQQLPMVEALPKIEAMV